MPRRILLLLPLLAGITFAQTKLLRFPDIHGDSVAFVYAGDLWKASVQGGRAVRLTADAGLELFPKFSPDGRWIAFTGQYDGDEQVYVMPSDGGEPTRLTFYPARGPLAPRWGYEHQVYGWTPDSSAVLFRSSRSYWGAKDGMLYTVSIEGGLPTPLRDARLRRPVPFRRTVRSSLIRRSSATSERGSATKEDGPRISTSSTDLRGRPLASPTMFVRIATRCGLERISCSLPIGTAP